MKRFITSTFLLLSILFVQAQKISRVTIANASTVESLTIGLDDAVIVINENGTITNYGVENFSDKIPNYSRIDPYTGRTENYATTDDKAFQGKIKYIGRTGITYYASYDLPELQGKIKSIGNLVFTYYMSFEDASLKGKIKAIGASSFSYYSSYENDAIKGKLKSIGNTTLVYYGGFDDKAIKGKIKSIGFASFTYYTSFDKQFAGSMKTGVRMQNINGITFLVN
jgi:BspA type Leucine rich repeat region (6 copies)